MMRKMVQGWLVAAVLLASVIAAPQRVAASDNLEYIIPAAVAGVVAVIVIVAIVMADRTEPEMDYFTAGLDLKPRDGGLRLGPDCAPTAGAMPLLCW